MRKLTRDERRDLQRVLARAAELVSDGDVRSLEDAAIVGHFIFRLAAGGDRAAETDYLIAVQDAAPGDSLYQDLEAAIERRSSVA
jgi:hypothetical protein